MRNMTFYFTSSTGSTSFISQFVFSTHLVNFVSQGFPPYRKLATRHTLYTQQIVTSLRPSARVTTSSLTAWSPGAGFPERSTFDPRPTRVVKCSAHVTSFMRPICYPYGTLQKQVQGRFPEILKYSSWWILKWFSIEEQANSLTLNGHQLIFNIIRDSVWLQKCLLTKKV